MTLRQYAPSRSGDSSFALLSAAIAITAAYCAFSIIVRPAMFSDSGYGFLFLDALRQGQPFNTHAAPRPDDISTDISTFMTWWSPGQYWFPGLFEAAGLSLGTSMALTAGAFSLLGLMGSYVLFRAFGFPAFSCALAVLVIATMRFFSLPFRIYNGGEVLLFGVAPWFCLLAWRLRELHLPQALWLLPAMCVLVFAKLTGVIVAITVVGACVIGPPPWKPIHILRRATAAALVTGLFAASLYIFWISRGSTPASAAGSLNWSNLWSGGIVAINAIALSSLSVGELLSNLLMHPSRPVLSSLLVVQLVLLPFSIILLLMFWRHLHQTHRDYVWFVLLTTAGYFAVMMVIYVRGGAVSIEERHFRFLSLLVLIGFVHFVITSRSGLLKWSGMAAFALMSVYGVSSLVMNARLQAAQPLSVRGFRHAIAPEPALRFLAEVDRAAASGGRTVVVIPSPEIGLELRQVRLITRHADFEALADLRRHEFRGRVDRIVVLVQERLKHDGKADAILGWFRDYPREAWHERDLGTFVAFEQGRPAP